MQLQAMQASKWLKMQLLIDASEMRSLLTALGDFEIYIPGSVLPRGHGHITRKQFLKSYESYIEALKEGNIPQESSFRQSLSAFFSRDPQAQAAVNLGLDKELWRILRPVLQFQPHSLDYTPLDGKFRPMVYGLDSVLWGVQISYPQLFMDTQTQEPRTVIESPEFPNTVLYKIAQRWIRNQTIPTPFLVEGHKINVPMRLGKECLVWINRHPQLVSKNIQVA